MRLQKEKGLAPQKKNLKTKRESEVQSTVNPGHLRDGFQKKPDSANRSTIL